MEVNGRMVWDEDIFLQCMTLVKDVPKPGPPRFEGPGRNEIAAQHYTRLTGVTVSRKAISSHQSVLVHRIRRRLERAALEPGDLEHERLFSRPYPQRWHSLDEGVVQAEAGKWGITVQDGMGEDALWNAVLHKRLYALAARIFCPYGDPDAEALTIVIGYALCIKKVDQDDETSWAFEAFADLHDPDVLWNKLSCALKEQRLGGEFFDRLLNAISSHVRQDGVVVEYSETEHGQVEESDDDEENTDGEVGDEGLGLERKYERTSEGFGLDVYAPASEKELSRWREQNVLQTGMEQARAGA